MATVNWRKLIKKTGKVLLWTVGVLVFLLFGLYLALRSPTVQTWLAQKATDYLSKELDTKVTVGGVDIEFVKKIVLEDLYIQDKHGDTLIYAHRLKADLSDFSYKQRFLSVKDVSLVDATIKIKKYGGERGLNYRFILLYLRKGDKPKEPTKHPWDVQLQGVTLTNVTVAYIDTRDTKQRRGLNHKNILVRDINANVSNFTQDADTTHFRINYLAANEKSGFTVNKMEALVAASDKRIQLDNLDIQTPGSHIDGFLGFKFDSIEAFEDDFNHLVKMDAHFSNSKLEMGDLSFFAPELMGIHQTLFITGDVTGTVDRLRCKDTEIRFGKSSRVVGNFRFNGLPDIDETDMNLKIRELTTNAADLRELPIPPFDSGEKLKVSDEIALLGNVRFAGSFEGFISDFVAHGKLQTAIGNLTLRNLAMVNPGEGKPEEYNGELFAENFDIGRYLDVPGMGQTTADLKVDGSGLRTENVRANVDGQVSSLTYYGYNYSNAQVNGVLAKRTFEGLLQLNDPNAHLTFDGLVDFTDKTKPKMNFKAQIDTADLVALKLMPEGHQHILSMNLGFGLVGNNIDNMLGSMYVSKLQYLRDGETFNFNELQLYATEDQASNTRTLKLDADFLIANITGNYKLLELPASVMDLMSNYLPSYFPKDKNKKIADQDFKYSFDFRGDTHPIQAVFPGLVLKPGTSFGGTFKTGQKIVESHLTSPSITYSGIRFDNLQIIAQNGKGPLHIDAYSGRVNIRDTLGLNKARIACDMARDSVIFKNSWEEGSSPIDNGLMVGFAHFLGPKSIEGKLLKTDFTYNDSIWSVSPGNSLRIDSSHIAIHDMMFRSGKQAVGLDGFISQNPQEQLRITLEHFNLDYINPFIASSNITLKGFVDSRTDLSELYATPIFSSNTDFSQFVVNDYKLGYGSFDANWIKAKDGIFLHGDFSKLNNDTRNVTFEGYYYPRKIQNSLDLQADIEGFELAFLQPFLKDVSSKIFGQARGHVAITGTPESPKLNGDMYAWGKGIRIDYLGLVLGFQEQKITLEDNAFAVDSFRIFDAYGDTTYVYGHLFHQNFNKFQFDFDMEMSHFCMLDTKPAEGSSFYGTVFATGLVNIYGPLDHVVINVDAYTASGTSKGKPIPTKFYIPMVTTSEASESDFISFKKTGNLNDADSLKTKSSSDSGVDIYMNIDARPDAEVQVIFDKTVGDQLIAHGAGLINMRVMSNGDFDIKGDYVLTDGSYNFTLKNVINAKFVLSPGSSMHWNGDPYKAIIDADAIYKVTASVAPLFPGDTITQAYNRSYPVDVIMHLDDLLMNPSITFDIKLPTADPSIQETLDSYTQTELEMNKQVLALMVLSSFLTPQETTTASDPALGGVVSSTVLSNFVSSQLSNWLSQISEDFNVGVIYRPNDDLNAQELKLYLGTQLFNNRVTIDGNVGVQGTNPTQAAATNAAGQIVGDVNVEYKVTDDGRVRLRAFNRTNDNALLNTGSLYTQGAGLFYREDFDDWSILMHRYREYLRSSNPNRDKSKQDLPKPAPAQVPADSTKVRP